MRLTNDIRHFIVRGVLAHKHRETFIEILDVRRQLVEKIIDCVMSRGSHRAIYESTPAGWFPKFNSISVALDGKFFRFPINGDLYNTYRSSSVHAGIFGELSNPLYRELPDFFRDAILLDETKDRELIDEIKVVHDRSEEFEDEYQKDSKKLEVIISEFNSDTKLIEAWPELAPFIPKEEKKSNIIVPVEKLNKEFELPV